MATSNERFVFSAQPAPSQENVPEELVKVFGVINNKQQEMVDLLKEAVAIESISEWPQFRDEVVRMMHWMKEKLEKEGASCELKDMGWETGLCGRKLKLPPVLLGELGKDPKKKTVLVYGHLDVDPACKGDGWYTEPFVLTEKDGKLFGRGSTDDKGPVLGWLHAIRAFKEAGSSLPVNLKFIFAGMEEFDYDSMEESDSEGMEESDSEGMEESDSEGLDDLLFSMKGGPFLSQVDYVCISNNSWLSIENPCFTDGLRRLCYFAVEVEYAKKDLHSGVFRGSVHEAMMADLKSMMSNLTDQFGVIQIPGILDDVAPLMDEDHANLLDPSRWQDPIEEDRYPSLSLHGVEGAFDGSGAKTVIPCKVSGKFSIRIVPNQKPAKVEAVVKAHIQNLWKQRKRPYKVTVHMLSGGRWWASHPNGPNSEAGKAAMRHVYGVDFDMSRVGGSTAALTLQKVTGKSVVLLSMGASDDGVHSQNEKIDKRNYIEGSKLLAAYLYEIAQLK